MNMDKKNFIDLVTSIPVDNEDIAFFSTIKCALPYLDVASAFQPIAFASRCEQNQASETSKTSDTFFNLALNTANTIPRILPLIHRDILKMCREKQNTKAIQDPPNPVIVFLVQIGTSSNGFQDTVHGGVLASLLDESLGYCAEALSCCLDATRQHPLAQETRLYTANLNISYRSPITSPGTVIIKAWFRRKEGRKWFLGAETVGVDGRVRTEATALWIREKTQSML